MCLMGTPVSFHDLFSCMKKGWLGPINVVHHNYLAPCGGASDPDSPLTVEYSALFRFRATGYEREKFSWGES